MTGILLSGGKSLRMGSDKAFVKINEQPMITYPLKVLEAWCSQILISANNAKLDFLGYPVIRDEIPDIGPLGGLYSCLKQSSNEINLLIACDMPQVTGTLLDRMLCLANQHEVVVPVINQHVEPLFALYQKNILSRIKQSIDEKRYSMRKFLSKLDVYYFEIEPSEVSEFLNVNTPSEII